MSTLSVAAADLKFRLDEAEYAKGEQLFRKGRTRLAEESGALLRYAVSDETRYDVQLTVEGPVKCSCAYWLEHGVCCHTAAAVMDACHSGVMDAMRRKHAQNSAPRLMEAMENCIPDAGNIQMEITLSCQTGTQEQAPALRIGLRMGEERLYVVKSIMQLVECMETLQPLDFGKGFCYQPDWMHPGGAQANVLEIIRSLCLARKSADASTHTPDAKQLPLPEPFAESILNELKNTSFRMSVGDRNFVVRRVQSARLPLHYKLTGSLRGLSLTAFYPRDLLPLTSSCSYVLVGDKVIAVDSDQRQILKALYSEQFHGISMFEFPTRQSNQVVGELLPFLKLTGTVEVDPQLEKQMIRLPLSARVYLDRADKEVQAKTEFVYGDVVIDPFAEEENEPTKPGRLLLRDGGLERSILDLLGSAGFYVRRGTVYLSGAEKIYDFVTDGVRSLQGLCEVFFSNDFKKLTPRRPNIRSTMRMNGNRLELQFTEDGEPSEEILAILEALSRQRRYFRLKDGSFLDLSAMEEWRQLADAVTEAAQAEGLDRGDRPDGVISLNAYRAAYFTELVGDQQLPITLDETVRRIAADLNGAEEAAVSLPEGFTLRNYQERGYRWLMTLDRLRMGGVLADDMGLGKTIQVIAMLKANKGCGKMALVIAPTSLTYNWLGELERFAPELSAMVISGSGPQRAAQINHATNAKDLDVLITSYPLLRRDIEMLREIPFRFAILDEAQHVKNAGSVGAAAVRQLQAETRLALTGTPMENSISELWSIFDFVLPGYLSGLSAFLRRYQDGQNADELQRKIRPFLLRRLKKEVLSDLPDKTERVMTAVMTAEQEKVYQASMLRLRTRVDMLLAEKGMGKSRTEVLSAMTELRQICCHPSLVLDDYAGESGKLDLLLDILPGAVQEGRRILLFSQFTTMLKIILKRLTAEGYSCMYLDGDTPSRQRVELADKFNSGEAQVFLISLKAGGTGLNLTGADTVIHYDPWWNPAAEEQAADRAHRIGQKRKVEVIRLVTHGTIEEQVVELGRRKRALFDQLITPGEELVTALSEQDIRALFA
ncbi:MAG: DEAD/DEAH box helicase [Clostridia bacterium]|nr:DEAD/DEAH box helicase [Clostridia bacterium]